MVIFRFVSAYDTGPLSVNGMKEEQRVSHTATKEYNPCLRYPYPCHTTTTPTGPRGHTWLHIPLLTHYVSNTGSQGSANGFGQRRPSGAKVRPQLAGRSVFNTT